MVSAAWTRKSRGYPLLHLAGTNVIYDRLPTPKGSHRIETLTLLKVEIRFVGSFARRLKNYYTERRNQRDLVVTSS